MEEPDLESKIPFTFKSQETGLICGDIFTSRMVAQSDLGASKKEVTKILGFKDKTNSLYRLWLR